MSSADLPTTTPHIIEGEARPVVDTPPDALHLITCLLVGGGIEATELLINHARAWQERFAATPRLLPIPGEQSAADLLRYALIGLVFDGEERLRGYTAQWGEQLVGALGVAAQTARPVTDSRLMAPLQRPLRSLSRQMQSELTRLIRRGRVEEAVSRMMATEVSDELISVILGYLSSKPEVRRLIEEQGTSLVGEMLDEARNQSAAADGMLEAYIRRLFNQAPSQSVPPPGSST